MKADKSCIVIIMAELLKPGACACRLHLACTLNQQLSTALGNADAQKQATALREQLSKAEADNAAEVQTLQQAESKLKDVLKQARLDVQQVLRLTFPQLAGKGVLPSYIE